MKAFILTITLAMFGTAGLAQKQPPAKAVAKAKPDAVKKDDKADFEKAAAIENAEEKIKALEAFIADHPSSEFHLKARESLAATRVLVGGQKLEANDLPAAVEHLKKAVVEAPVPYPERLFNEALSKVPALLYFGGKRVAAMESALLIEKNSQDKAPHLLALANFYLSIENGDQAKRLAEAAIALDENSAAAYQTLALSHRLNFDLESSSAAYEKALALDPDSAVAKRSLADVKRAIGKHDDAIALYRSILEADANDSGARTGLVLALFDAGKRPEAETELARALEADAGNLLLLGSVAYQYAAAGDAEKVVEYAQKAINIEPRFIWPHIALGRGLLLQGKYSEAEQVLLKAREHGNFPTLEYEIASARLAGGFYREAAEELAKSFTVADGQVNTKLGRRVERSANTFTDLLSSERRASIFVSSTADAPNNAEQLKALLELHQAVRNSSSDAQRTAELAAAFARGTDKMRFFRQLYAADVLLDKKIAPDKALELAKTAMAGVDDALNVQQPAGPVMASELYESRTAALTAGRYVLVPDVPKQTLSAIARGRIEEVAGRALFEQNNFPEAATRFRRALSVLPENSAWWRSTMWRLGNALEAEKKDKEALDAYVKVYKSDSPNVIRYAVIEGLYKKINGNGEGLDALVGTNPAASVQTAARADTEKKVEGEAAVPVKIDTEATPQTDAQAKPSDAETGRAPATKEELKNEKAASPDVKPSDQKEVVEAAPPRAEPSPEVKSTGQQETPVKKVEAEAEEKPKVNDQPAEVAPEVPVDKKPEKTEPPTPEKTTEPKAEEKDSAADQKPEIEPEKRSEKTPPTAPSDLPAAAEDKAAKPADARKPLFEPVVIEIRTPKPKTEGAAAKEEKKPVAEPDAPPSNAGEEKPKDVVERPRLVDGKEVAGDIPTPCVVTVSQENISLIGGGGSVGLLVGLDGEADAKQIKAVSSSPGDIEVVLEPEIAGVPNRAFYIIRSLTTNTGVYQIEFAAPCGKRNVVVRVR